MSQEITLQALINKVKTDLLTPPSDPETLLFFVEKVELELTVAITEDKGAGIKISLLDFFGGEVTGKDTEAKGHKVLVTLTPILTLDEQRELIRNNPQLKRLVEKASLSTLKSSDSELVGKPE